MIRKYFKDASLLAVTGGLLQLRGLIIIPFLTRHFGPINYGAWSQVSILISTLAPLVVLGTDSAVFRFLPGQPLEKQKRFFSARIIFLFGMALLVSTPLLALRDPLAVLFFGETGEYAQFLPLAALWLISGAMANGALNWFQIRNNVKVFAAGNLLQSILSVAAVALMLVRNENAYQLVLYSLLSDVVLFAFGSFLIWREGNWAKPDFSILRPLLKYGLPLVPGAFAVWALNYVDRIFIVQMLTLQQAGIYSLAYSIANQISPLLVRPWRVMFANSAAELYSQKDTSTLQRLFERSAGLTFILSLPASVGLFLLGHRLFALFATEEFSQGVPALLFVSLGYIFLMLSSYYEIALGLVFKQYLSTWFYLIALIVNVLLNLILIPRFTITGAAFATMIAFFAILALSMYYSSKYNLLHTNFVFVAKVGVATAGMAIAVQLLNGVVGRLGQPILELLLLAFLGCLVFAGLLWVFGVLTKREFDLALSIVRK